MTLQHQSRCKIARRFATVLALLLSAVLINGAAQWSHADVSEETLSGLRAERPREYFDYAQQLAAQPDDTEARETALRLYVIAAFLDPGNLGFDAFRAMEPLARSETERRRFRAMAYLLDPGHDKKWIERKPTEPADDSTAAATNDPDAGSTALLNTLRMLRSGQRSEALAIAKRPLVSEALSRHGSVLTTSEFAEAAQSVCESCEEGKLTCARCGGAGRRKIGASFRKCTDCDGKGGIACAVCNGDYRSAGMSVELLGKILRLELLLSSGANDSKQADDGLAASWAKAAAAGAPAPILGLETITEFDPRKNFYLRGRWVEP